jgi:ParB family protein of integrating conjugative element (PFGI_1 class)
MSRKQPVDNLRNLMGLRGFDSQSRDLPPADPPVSTLIVVDLDRIDLYDLNPRRQDNAVYERLRESIRVNGLDNPIPITRRPGAERYIVAAGGNTRLKALRELYRQTGHTKFAKVNCIFKPFTSDIDILAAHLRENDLRDDLVFIDHAVAVQTLKGMLEESGGKPLNRSEFERLLSDMGHPVSRRDLGRMEYAVAVLYPVIPLALQHGAGPRLIDRIGVLEGAYRKYYEDLPDPRPAFHPLFEDVLSLCDGPVLDLEAVRENLDHRIAEATRIPAHRVRLGVEAELTVTGRNGPGRATDPAQSTAAGAAVPPSQPPRNETPSPAEPSAREAATFAAEGNGSRPQSAPGHTVVSDKVSTGRPEREDAFAQGQASPLIGGEAERRDAPLAPRKDAEVPMPENRATVSDQRIGSDGSTADSGPASEIVAPEPGVTAGELQGSNAYLNPWLEGGREHLPRPEDIKSLRSRTYILATQLAQNAGLQALVQPDRDAPAGFVLRDLAAGASESETILWWLLAALSGSESFDQMPREHACLYDPAAFVWQALFRFEAGRPPSDTLLRQIFLLIEAIAALARARAGATEPV